MKKNAIVIVVLSAQMLYLCCCSSSPTENPVKGFFTVIKTDLKAGGHTDTLSTTNSLGYVFHDDIPDYKGRTENEAVVSALFNSVNFNYTVRALYHDLLDEHIALEINGEEVVSLDPTLCNFSASGANGSTTKIEHPADSIVYTVSFDVHK